MKDHKKTKEQQHSYMGKDLTVAATPSTQYIGTNVLLMTAVSGTIPLAIS
jgi:hypothetical protein